MRVIFGVEKISINFMGLTRNLHYFWVAEKINCRINS